ncbi:MAG: HAD-IA family hydrolase [Candidatus Aminicenantes bacterium]|nr:HAD-IA family hydrolase [Candidatus Aminicenantes bacterium]
MALRAALFDLDGTVVENAYDWPRIKTELETGGTPILTYLHGLAEPERSRKWAILERHETEQTERSTLRPGMAELLAFLKEKCVGTALVTNNSERNVRLLTEKFRLSFDVVLSRASGLWKPSGAPLRAALRRLGAAPEESCVIGDTRFDVLAAREAGISRVFVLDASAAGDGDSEVEVVAGAAPLLARLKTLLA